MGNDTAEYELRCRAIKLRQQGTSFAQVLARLGRGRMWLAKWWRRFQQSGWAGLKMARLSAVTVGEPLARSHAANPLSKSEPGRASACA